MVKHTWITKPVSGSSSQLPFNIVFFTIHCRQFFKKTDEYYCGAEIFNIVLIFIPTRCTQFLTVLIPHPFSRHYPPPDITGRAALAAKSSVIVLFLSSVVVRLFSSQYWCLLAIEKSLWAFVLRGHRKFGITDLRLSTKPSPSLGAPTSRVRFHPRPQEPSGVAPLPEGSPLFHEERWCTWLARGLSRSRSALGRSEATLPSQGVSCGFNITGQWLKSPNRRISQGGR